MMLRAGLVALTAIAVAAPACASAQQGLPPEGSGLSAVAFMVGCWRQPSDNGLRERYAPPASNMMTGLSQFWRGGRIVDWEFHRVDAGHEGPVLTPHPRGVASVSFAPAVMEEGRIVWENLDHDFPQRIIYHRVAPDSLVARIEGGTGEAARFLEWRMVRTDCSA